MDNPNKIHKKLELIRKLLLEKNVNHLKVYRRVSSVLREANYYRTPYYFDIPMVRRAISKNDPDWFNNISKLECIPDELSTLQRCNWSNDPVFYCSSDNVAPVYEIRGKVGDFIVISAWVDNRNENIEITYPIELLGLALGVKRILASPMKSDSFKELLNNNDDIFKDDIPANIVTIDEYMGDLFSEESSSTKNLYMYTSAFSKFLFKNSSFHRSNRNLDAIIYPSVEGKFTAVNIAIDKVFAREQLKLYGASMYEIIEFNESKAQYILKPLRGVKNVLEDGKLEWKNVHKKHSNERFIFSPETESRDYDSTHHLSYEDE